MAKPAQTYSKTKVYRLRKVHLLSEERFQETMCGLTINEADVRPLEITNREEKANCGNCLKLLLAFRRHGYWPDYGRRKK